MSVPINTSTSLGMPIKVAVPVYVTGRFRQFLVPSIIIIRHRLKKANQRLVFAIICVSLLVLSLGVLAFYVNKQKKYVTIARNELKKTNEQLEELNKKLSATNEMLKTSNDKLNESNGVKEEYIGQFLGACSHYIDKLDKLRLHVNKMVKNREYQELYSMTRSSELKEHELGELYTNFDKVFLHLFPNFVEDLNSLLEARGTNSSY